MIYTQGAPGVSGGWCGVKGGRMKSCCLAGLFEDLALVELPALGISALPLEVLSHQLFALVRGGVQLAPTKVQRHVKTDRLYEEKIIESYTTVAS